MNILKLLFRKEKIENPQSDLPSDFVSIHPKEETKQKMLQFLFCLPEYTAETTIYGCIMHHPLKSAWVTPTSYPVDEIHIVHNGLMEKQYTYKTKQDMVTITMTDACSLQINRTAEIVLDAKWDTKITYHLPICDATESWEFVFSKKPIDERMYLGGYVQKYENYYLCEDDLRKGISCFYDKTNCGTKTNGKTLEAEKDYRISQMKRKNELIPKKIKRLVDFRIRIEFLFVKRQVGLCYRIWNRQKQLYDHYGYEWYTPAELNPNITFD